MIIGHRGYSSCFIDNSRESFENAIHIGFDMIELDINICKSGELIVYHDLLLDGKSITEYTMIELAKKNIISLQEYFLINENRVKTYIDVKGDANVMNALILFFNESSIYLDDIYVASFDIQQINILKNSNINVKCGLITSNKLTEHELEFFLHLDFFAFNWEEYNNEIYQFLQRYNKPVFLYTCHDMKELHYIQNVYQYDGLISNIFVNYLNR